MVEVKDYPPYLDYSKPYKPKTNADCIRSMSDEELASFIDSETTNCAPHGDCKKVCDDCKACWLYWLQQPAEGE